MPALRSGDLKELIEDIQRLQGKEPGAFSFLDAVKFHMQVPESSALSRVAAEWKPLRMCRCKACLYSASGEFECAKCANQDTLKLVQWGKAMWECECYIMLGLYRG